MINRKLSSSSAAVLSAVVLATVLPATALAAAGAGGQPADIDNAYEAVDAWGLPPPPPLNAEVLVSSGWPYPRVMNCSGPASVVMFAPMNQCVPGMSFRGSWSNAAYYEYWGGGDSEVMYYFFPSAQPVDAPCSQGNFSNVVQLGSCYQGQLATVSVFFPAPLVQVAQFNWDDSAPKCEPVRSATTVGPMFYLSANNNSMTASTTTSTSTTSTTTTLSTPAPLIPIPPPCNDYLDFKTDSMVASITIVTDPGSATAVWTEYPVGSNCTGTPSFTASFQAGDCVYDGSGHAIVLQWAMS